MERINEENFAALTVEDLHKILTGIIEMGYGKKTVELSVSYDCCEYSQELGEVRTNGSDISWITLKGLKR